MKIPKLSDEQFAKAQEGLKRYREQQQRSKVTYGSSYVMKNSNYVSSAINSRERFEVFDTSKSLLNGDGPVKPTLNPFSGGTSRYTYGCSGLLRSTIANPSTSGTPVSVPSENKKKKKKKKKKKTSTDGPTIIIPSDNTLNVTSDANSVYNPGPGNPVTDTGGISPGTPVVSIIDEEGPILEVPSDNSTNYSYDDYTPQNIDTSTNTTTFEYYDDSTSNESTVEIPIENETYTPPVEPIRNTSGSGSVNYSDTGIGYDKSYSSSNGRNYHLYNQSNIAEYSYDNYCGSSIGYDGCGVTSLTTILTGHGSNKHPGQVVSELSSVSGNYGLGSIPQLKAQFAFYGFNVDEHDANYESMDTSIANLRTHLQSGGEAVLVGYNMAGGQTKYCDLNGNYTNEYGFQASYGNYGHWVSAIGISDDGKYVFVSDSAGSDGWCKIEDLFLSSGTNTGQYLLVSRDY